MKKNKTKHKTLIIISVGLILLSVGLYKMIFGTPGISISPKYQYPMIVNGGELIILGLGFLIGGLFLNKKKSEPKLKEIRKNYLKHY